MVMRRQWVAGVACAVSMALSQGAQAQEKTISIELNDATDISGACRLVFVAVNKTGVVLDKTSYDVVTFDTAGKVGQSLTFQFGKLSLGKTKVVQFDLASPPCEELSRILVNGLDQCQSDGADTDICFTQLVTRNLTDISFE